MQIFYFHSLHGQFLLGGVHKHNLPTAVPIQCNIQLSQLPIPLNWKKHKNSVKLKFIITKGIQVSLGKSAHGNLAWWSTVMEALPYPTYISSSPFVHNQPGPRLPRNGKEMNPDILWQHPQQEVYITENEES